MRWDPICGLFRVYEFGGGGSSAPSSTTTVAQNFSPEEAAQRAKVQEEANRIYQQTAGQISGAPYPGAAPVPFSPESIQAQNMLSAYSTGPGAQLANNAANFSAWMMGPAQYAEANPYLSSAINAAITPVTQAYTGPGGVYSVIRNSAGSSGQYGGTRQGVAEGVAARGYTQTVGDISSKMAMENFQNSQKLGMQAAAMAPQTFALGAAPAENLASVGTQKEQLNQAMEDYAANSRAWNLNSAWTPLQNYANIVFGGATPGTTTQSQGSVPQASRFGSTLGAAASGASMASLFGINPMLGAGVGLLSGLFG